MITVIKGEEYTTIETPLFTRLLWAERNLKPVQPDYVIVWENDIDSPMSIFTPSPEWMGQAISGGILPPVDAYLHDRKLSDGEKATHPYVDPIGPMTEEEAMEYAIKLIVPEHILNTNSNRPKFKICKQSAIPTNRDCREAWRLTA